MLIPEKNVTDKSQRQSQQLGLTWTKEEKGQQEEDIEPSPTTPEEHHHDSVRMWKGAGLGVENMIIISRK